MHVNMKSVMNMKEESAIDHGILVLLRVVFPWEIPSKKWWCQTVGTFRWALDEERTLGMQGGSSEQLLPALGEWNTQFNNGCVLWYLVLPCQGGMAWVRRNAVSPLKSFWWGRCRRLKHLILISTNWEWDAGNLIYVSKVIHFHET